MAASFGVRDGEAAMAELDIGAREAGYRGEMMLYASGFNAFNQLSFPPSMAGHGEPSDLHVFEAIFGGDEIQRPQASLYHTSVRRNGSMFTTGATAGAPVRRQEAIGYGWIPAETPTGQVLVAQQERVNNNQPGGAVRHKLVKYPSWDACMRRTDEVSWVCEVAVKQIAAFEAGFVILYEDGSVATLGDGRFPDCLGRDVSSESPADQPCIVHDLNDLDGPIRLVAAGGYTVAAVTEGGSLYVWGTATNGIHRREQAFSTLSGMPSYVEVDGGKDVRDVGVGESHAIVLTTDGNIYVIGGNDNGQLGLGESFRGRAETWQNLHFQPPAGVEVTGVSAGPRASFILTSQL